MSDAPLDKKETIEELFQVRAEIAELELKHIKKLKERKAILETQVLSMLEVGEKSAYAGVGSVSVKEEIQPKITDWDALYDFIKANDAFYLMPRKINGAPYREALEAANNGVADPIPGIEPVTIRKLSVTKTA
jgi:hypothetical protein